MGSIFGRRALRGRLHSPFRACRRRQRAGGDALADRRPQGGLRRASRRTREPPAGAAGAMATRQSGSPSRRPRRPGPRRPSRSARTPPPRRRPRRPRRRSGGPDARAPPPPRGAGTASASAFNPAISLILGGTYANLSRDPARYRSRASSPAAATSARAAQLRPRRIGAEPGRQHRPDVLRPDDGRDHRRRAQSGSRRRCSSARVSSTART